MGKKRETTSGPGQIRILNDAFLDIEQISHFIAIEKQQPLNAVIVARTFWQIINRIAENPFAFKECKDPHSN